MATQNLMAASSALPQVLVSQQLASSETTQYTGPANSAVKLSSAVLTNTGAVACPVSLSLVKTGGSAGAANRVLSAYSLAPGDDTVVSELAGHFLGPGDFISAVASALVQTVTITGGAGTFTLTVVINGVSATTSAIAFNATAATVLAAFTALSNVGVGNVTVGGSTGGPYTVTFGGLGTGLIPVMTGAGSGGASVAIAGTASAVALVVSGVVFS